MAFKIPGRWTDVLPDNIASAQLENELQRMILRGMEQGARFSDIARSLKLSRAQACQLYKAALLAKAVPVLIYFKEREVPHRNQAKSIFSRLGRSRPTAEEAGLEKCLSGDGCFRISYRIMRESASFRQRARLLPFYRSTSSVL